MNDLISRSALRDLLYEEDAITMRGLAMLNTFPAVDAVPVVRCGECEKRKTTECALSYFVFDNFDVEIHFLDMPDDFYCPYGERKTDV